MAQPLGATLSSVDLTPADRPPWRSGTFFYCPPFRTVANTVLVQSTLYSIPFYIPKSMTIIKIGVVSTGVASSAARLGIYADNGGIPDALIIDAGSVGTTGGAFASITISQLLAQGWYWGAAAVQGAAGNLQCSTASFQVPTPAPFSAATQAGYSQTGITAGLPSPWGATLTIAGTMPLVFLGI